MSDETDVLGQSFTGVLHITIEGLGALKVESLDEPLRILVAQAEAFMSGRTLLVGGRNNPYELVSFDKEGAKLVVRKK